MRIILIIGSYIFMIYKWLLGHTNLIFSLMGETMKNLGSVGRSVGHIMDFKNSSTF